MFGSGFGDKIQKQKKFRKNFGFQIKSVPLQSDYYPKK